MAASLKQVIVHADEYRVARDSMLFVAHLQAALAITVHDETQGTGGLLHLRYVATENDQPLELTDNTLSSNLLLLDRYCKELRMLGARKHSWQVRLIAHTPDQPDMDATAATVLDLVQAYFADSRLPVETREVRKGESLIARLNPREGQLWVHGGSPDPALQSVAALR